MTPAKIPLQRCSTSAAAAISSAPASQRSFSATASNASLSIEFSARVQKAVSWLQGQGQTQVQSTVTTTTSQLHPPQHHRAHSLLLHSGTVHQPHYPHLSNAALFSTTGAAQRLSKEEEDLYQALTVSFRTRIAEQVHKPEDGYKSVIEHWTAHTQRDVLTRQRTKARKERLAGAAKHKDIAFIQREQEKLSLEASATADDYFYVIQAWIKCGELKRATLAFEKMESVGIPLTVRTLAAMTRAHARSGNVAVAGTMVQKMKDMNLHPSSIYDLSALLEYYIKLTPVPNTSHATSTIGSQAGTGGAGFKASLDPSQTRVQEIWNVIEPQLQASASATASNNAAFSYRTYLVYLVNRAQNLESAVDLIDKMMARNISPELEKYQKTAVLILGRLTQQGYLTEVQKLLEQKDATLGKVVPATVWSDLMEAYMSRGENQKSRWIYNDMLHHGIVPSAKCKKLFSDLQLMGGTKDEGSPLAKQQQQSEQDLLSILFHRAPKPIVS
ncbi:hypothetical protein BGZ93_010597 [Podila epicladia]|nr:hypothetical protein BGZ92_002147 [Podila epicladia]KAG0098715.1 hypothetical protein BGZ93_010597 [Podila epicladia]